jgi:hypothetical protein
MQSVNIVYSDVVENIQSAAFTVARINSSHGRTVSAPSVDAMSRIPFKVSAYHTGLTCRFVETAEAVVTVFKAKQFAATITLTQSVVMTTAALWQLHDKVSTALARSDLALLDSQLDLVYSRLPADRHASPQESIAVMGFIHHAAADMPGFQQMCEGFLRLESPEWIGTGQLYADAQSDGCAQRFRYRLTRDDNAIELTAKVLRLTTLAFEHYSRDLTRIMPRLADLDAKKNEAGKSGTVFGDAAWNEAGLRAL